jgi:hypothetical protein
MKSKRNMMIIGLVAAVCLIAARLAISIPAKVSNYEIEPVITTPEYRTDAARAIDAYERLMERYMDLAESHLMDNQSVAQKLDSIDAKMSDLSTRLARIEKALGIDPNGVVTSKPQKSSTDK